MKVESKNSGFSHLFHSVREGLGRYLPEASYEAHIILESSALVQLSYTSLKNVPFAFLAKEFDINTISHSLSTRVDFIEATLMCVVSLIYQLACTIFYTAAVVGTIGLSDHLNFRCSLHWTHATYAFISSGIGIVGVIYPYYGVGLNLMLLLSIWKSVKSCYDHDVYHFERPLIEKIRDIFQENKAFIYNTFRERVKNEAEYKIGRAHV